MTGVGTGRLDRAWGERWLLIAAVVVVTALCLDGDSPDQQDRSWWWRYRDVHVDIESSGYWELSEHLRQQSQPHDLGHEHQPSTPNASETAADKGLGLPVTKEQLEQAATSTLRPAQVQPLFDELQPALAVLAHHGQTPNASGQLGGHPRLPTDMAWPRRHGLPMQFQASLEITALRGAVADAGVDVELPTGISSLLVFFDTSTESIGEVPEDMGVVLAVPTDTPTTPREPPPESMPTPELALSVEPTWTMPARWSASSERTGLSFEDLSRVEEVLRSWPWHQAFGHPYPVQGHPAHLCAEGRDPDADDHAAMEDRWILLLQLSEDGGLMWADGGNLYVYVRRDDLMAGDFSQACVTFDSA